MSIASSDMRLLWSRAGGFCSHPDCTVELTILIESGSYSIGEMAHVIGRSPSARRGVPEGGNDTYENLILLCPNHHTHIDKSPEGTFSVELLHEWKQKQETLIQRACLSKLFENFEQLKTHISQLLAANKATFNAFGPASKTAQADPSSNLHSIWELKRLDQIIPNNRKILNAISRNKTLIPSSMFKIIGEFQTHAEAYEHHVHQRLDNYPGFPKSFEEAFN